MPLLPRPSSKAVSTVPTDRTDPTLPAILEYQSPSTAIINMPMPAIARNITLTISSMILVLMALAGLIKVDQVVVAQGIVISKAPTLVVQPLETSIVRSIEVTVGETVHAGQVLARLDPTFAAADMGALTAQVSALQAQASRMQAELDNRPFTYSGMDPNLTFQAAVYAQRQSEFNFKMENYRQKAESLAATIQRANADITNYTDRLKYAKTLEDMRRDLERMNVGSKLNTLAAQDNRAEMQRNLDNARDTATGAQRDLAALIAERNAFVQSWHNDVAEKLTDVLQKLSDAREQLNKAQLRRQLVELRAERDGTVLTIGKVSVGSVLQAGEQFITIVPSDAPLEIEANIAGRDDGYVHVGDPVTVKFDTFPYTQYGVAHGVVRLISANSFTPRDDERNPTGALPITSGSNTEVYFRARITLDSIDLHDTPPHFHLVPGMPITADIRVGKRTLVGAVLNRIVPLATEGMREP
ncbi:HlyD family type I secretion periplasmic adaptor subunit [Rhodopila sp.]|uniref:HlyD family type I secretion periplasmic adaptor subunit n=1 Tax=Rhodopila sp. TaxID=2480087 RepID=UPI002BE82860|nr:HlyD family type I secretion periplasmic adaptor subunit [Rhodopila sp.]HVZ10487.1 HlyD family type I secretion periplasmic adaptor subunit [Rhodopila sp.]